MTINAYFYIAETILYNNLASAFSLILHHSKFLLPLKGLAIWKKKKKNILMGAKHSLHTES